VRVREAGARPLFGGEIDITFWSRELAGGRATLCTYRYDGAARQGLPVGLTHAVWGRLQALPLAIRHGVGATPVDDQTRLHRGDLLTVLFAGPPSSPGHAFVRVERAAAPPMTSAATHARNRSLTTTRPWHVYEGWTEHLLSLRAGAPGPGNVARRPEGVAIFPGDRRDWRTGRHGRSKVGLTSRLESPEACRVPTELAYAAGGR
jgi:hypothetical protein